MQRKLRPGFAEWAAYTFLFGLQCWWLYRYVYQPFARGDQSDALTALLMMLVFVGIAVTARLKAASLDFRRR